MEKKRFIGAALVLIMLSVVPSCTNTARVTLRTAKEGLKLGNFTVTDYIKMEEVRCDSKEGAEKASCLDTATKLKKYWPPAYKTALQAVDLALEALDAVDKKEAEKNCSTLFPDEASEDYKNCVYRNKINVEALVKRAVCLVLTALDFVPETMKAKFSLYIELGKGFVCSKSTTTTFSPPSPKAHPVEFGSAIEARRKLLRAKYILSYLAR